MATKTKKVKGYKAFNPDLTCRGMQYEIGKTYEMNCEPVLCEKGFHFCQNFANIYDFYPMTEDTRVCEVEALGLVVTGENGVKSCTNKIRILREIENPKAKSNSGTGNSGWLNSGNHNSGSYNAGNHNSGNCNNGDLNSGDNNSGDYNSGDHNTGNRNSGDYNTGWYNSGNCNSGDHNSGCGNAGWYNRGNLNSGDYNSGNYNNGCFNTETNPRIKMFDRESGWTMRDWDASPAKRILINMPVRTFDAIYTSEMTDEEKTNHPECKTTGIYLRPTNISDEDRQAWWDRLTPKNKKIILSLPNFDADKFYQCTGIRV